MASIYQEKSADGTSKAWIVSARHRGEESIKHRFGLDQEAQARKLKIALDEQHTARAKSDARDRTTKLLLGAGAGTSVHSLTVADAIAELLATSNCADFWKRIGPSVIDRVGQFVKFRDLSQLWVEDYVATMRAPASNSDRKGKPYSYETIHKDFKLITRSARRAAKRRGAHAPPLPFDTSALFPKNWAQGRDRRLSSSEEASIRQRIAQVRPGLREHYDHLVTLALETGARLQEMVRAEWTEFDLDQEKWLIPAKHTKCKKLRRALLSSRARAALLALRADATPGESRVFFRLPQSPDSVSNYLRQMFADAGVHNLRVHDLRHEACSRMLSRKGGPGFGFVMKMLGHASKEMTDRYAHYDTQDFRGSLG